MNLNQLKLRSNSIKSWLPVLLWAVVIFLFSANPEPYRYLPAAWRSAVPLPTLTGSSAAELLGQLMHFIEYAVLAFLVARAFFSTMRSTTTNSSNRIGIGKTNLFNSLTAQQLNSLTVLLSMAFALSDEIHQIFVPGRTFQVIDLIIDFLGILFGVFLYTKLLLKQALRSPSED